MANANQKMTALRSLAAKKQARDARGRFAKSNSTVAQKNKATAADSTSPKAQKPLALTVQKIHPDDYLLLNKEMREWKSEADRIWEQAKQNGKPSKNLANGRKLIKGMIALTTPKGIAANKSRSHPNWYDKEAAFALRDKEGNLQSLAFVEDTGDKIHLGALMTAPWNLVEGDRRRIKGAGTQAVRSVVLHSMEQGHEGRVRLSAYEEAEPFYKKIGFKEVLFMELDSENAKKLIELTN